MTAKTAMLIDRFDNDGYTQSKWYIDPSYTSLLSLAGNRLTITPTTGYPGLISAIAYDLTASWVHIEVLQKLNTGNGSTSIEFGVRCGTDNGDKELFVIYGDGRIYFQERVDGVNNDTSVTFDPVAHRWLRLREAAGTLYWETSPDGLNWIVQRAKTPTHNLSSVQPVLSVGYWDTEPNPGVAVVDNINAYRVPATQQGWSVGVRGFGATDGGTLLYRNFFPEAEWLWTPIPADPVLDPDSAAIIADLTYAGTWGSTTFDGNAGVSMVDVSATLVAPALITKDTPRHHITFDHEDPALDPTGDYWGPNPFGDDLVPIPVGTVIPSGVDGHLAVADPVNGKVYSLWQAVYHPETDTYTASWGGVAPLTGDGIETAGSSTATNLSRYAAVLRMLELQAREIPHALFFASGNCKEDTFRYPATKTDGINYRGTAHPIEQGARVQLDPSIDVTALPGITPGEVAIGRALQKYGAYCGDKSDEGAGFGFICQIDPTATDSVHPGQTYVDAGFAYDYFKLTHIPWESLRVLKNWDGTDTEPEIGFSPP